MEGEMNGNEMEQRMARLEAMFGNISEMLVGQKQEPAPPPMPAAQAPGSVPLEAFIPPQFANVPREFKGTDWEPIIAAGITQLSFEFGEERGHYFVRCRTLRYDEADPTVMGAPDSTMAQMIAAGIERLQQTPRAGLKHGYDPNTEPQSPTSPEVLRQKDMFARRIARGG